MFNLRINPGGEKEDFNPLSSAVLYVVDDKYLKNNLLKLENKYGIKLSELQIKNITSKEGSEITFSKSNGFPDSIIISKVKLDKKFNADYFRNHLAGIIQKLEKEKVENLYITIPDFVQFNKHFEKEEYYYRTFIEGLFLGNYSFDKYKKDKKSPTELKVYLLSRKLKTLNSAIEKTLAVSEGIYFTRNLQNEPASSLRPFELANQVKTVLSKYGVRVTVFDEKEAKKRNMGGLLAVGMGSTNKPRFIIAHYKPKAVKKKIKKIALVGKGVTFDTGGYCVKPPQGMTEMKADMSGAAVVAGTLLAAAKAKLPIEILGIIPAAENMISGDAMRPGDVIKTASGITIEVGHTDAEGRMIINDALTYAARNYKPKAMFDFATLTGSMMIALGSHAIGYFSNDDDLAEVVENASKTSGERVWRMPLWEVYDQQLKSDIADFKHTGGRPGGAITAARFLSKFVDEVPWIHFDIAGSAGQESDKDYNPQGSKGVAVRLIVDAIRYWKK